MGFRSLSGAAGGAAFNNFVLSVGQSGNTTYVLDEAYPAGAYTLSNSGDTTFDVYAIGTDGTKVGYTNTTKLEASADIKEIVILGAAANEVFTFEFSGTVTTPTSKGDVASAGAFVTSIDPSSLPNVDDSVTVTGGNFAADVEAYFIDQNDNEVAAKALVRNSSTEIVVTRPDSFSTADSPFTIKVVNPNVTLPTGSSAHLLSNSITAGTNPVWQTAAGQFYSIGTANTITLVASDTEASDVDYAITAGSLPAGLTLDGETGVISGTPSGGADGDQTVFTVRATDAGGNFVDREFTFTANGAPTWTTTSSDIGNAGNISINDPFSFQFVADGGTGGGSLTYSVQSGTFPAGLSISSTGLLTGTPNTEETTTFTLRVTDEAGLFSDREFTVSIVQVTRMTGGVESDYNGYRYHTFTSAGSINVNALAQDTNIEFLIVAGGGGGGGGNRGGGGGAGGARIATVAANSLSTNSYNVVIGSGGSGGLGDDSNFPSPGGDGSNSSLFGISNTGGGGGGQGVSNSSLRNGRNGGSGGGGGSNGVTSGGSGISGQGFDGGGSNGADYSSPYNGGGGGGASAQGGPAFTNGGGNGGAGLLASDWATATSTGDAGYYAGGGGGGGFSDGYGSGGFGGTGGGGTGAKNSAAVSGNPNTGGGGGGGHNNSGEDGAVGGSGIVIVRYPL